jgi:hypothetical protein
MLLKRKYLSDKNESKKKGGKRMKRKKDRKVKAERKKE